MRKVKVGICLVICTNLLLSGCAMFGGDVPIRVAGSVPVRITKVGQPECTLAMLYADSGVVASRREVPAQFEARFVVEARSKPYYFVADCKDGREYKSGSIVAGGRGSFDKIFDLGTFIAK